MRIEQWTLAAALAGAAASGCVSDQIEPAPGEVASTEHAITYAGHDYLFVHSSRPWAEARTLCNLQGYDLVTIDSAAEQQFLYSEALLQPGDDFEYWFTGLNDQGAEGTWVWASGAVPGFASWSPGAPNGGAAENCAVLEAGFYGNGTWDDVPCNTSRPFICEKSSIPTGNDGSFHFTATNTNWATQNTVQHSVHLYANMLFTLGTCGVTGSWASGDTVLRLFDPSGAPVAFNNDACGALGSNLSYVVPADRAGTYTIRAGCAGNASCSGVVAYTFSSDVTQVYDLLRVGLTTSEKPDRLEVFFKRPGDTDYSEARKLSADITLTRELDYRIQLGSHPLYRGIISGLRVDPVARQVTSASGQFFAVNYIRLCRSSDPDVCLYQWEFNNVTPQRPITAPALDGWLIQGLSDSWAENGYWGGGGPDPRASINVTYASGL